MKSVDCLNCGQKVYGNYCSNCGQSTLLGSLKWKNIFEISRSSNAQSKANFFKTFWCMLTKPGQSIHNYLLGKRVQYLSPLRYFILAGAIAGFVILKTEPPESGLTDWLGNQISLVSAVFIPIQAFLLWLFVKAERNYVEVLVSQVFFLATMNILSIIELLSYYLGGREFFLRTDELFGIPQFGYLIWANVMAFKSYNLISRVFIAIFAVAMNLLVVVMLFILFLSIFNIRFSEINP